MQVSDVRSADMSCCFDADSSIVFTDNYEMLICSSTVFCGLIQNMLKFESTNTMT